MPVRERYKKAVKPTKTSTKREMFRRFLNQNSHKVWAILASSLVSACSVEDNKMIEYSQYDFTNSDVLKLLQAILDVLKLSSVF